MNYALDKIYVEKGIYRRKGGQGKINFNLDMVLERVRRNI